MRLLKNLWLWIIGFFGVAALIIIPTIHQPQIISTGAGESFDQYLLVNVQFDNDTNVTYDSSPYHHVFTANGAVSAIATDRDFCLYDGCGNFTAKSGDFYTATSKFNLSDQLAMEIWYYSESEPSGDNAIGLIHLYGGTEQTSSYHEEGGQPLIHLAAQGGVVGTGIGSANGTSATTWYQMFILYNGTHFSWYRNGNLLVQIPQAYGDINFSEGDTIRIGVGQGGTDHYGRIDSVRIWNYGGMTQPDILAMYYEKIQGTPPEIDLAVVGVSTDAIYNWSSSNNALYTTGTYHLNVTVNNYGTNASGNARTVIIADNGNVACEDTRSLSAGTNFTLECVLNHSSSYEKIKVYADYDGNINETAAYGSEDNNYLPVYKPGESHPRYQYNGADQESIISFISTPGTPAYEQFTYLTSNTFDKVNEPSTWTYLSMNSKSDDTLKWASKCILTGGTAESAECINAFEALDFFLINTSYDAETVLQTDDTQYLNPVIDLAITYDILFPYMTEQQALGYAAGMNNLCKQFLVWDQTQPYNGVKILNAFVGVDFSDAIVGDNGGFFAAAWNTPCSVSTGDYPPNPQNLVKPDTSRETYHPYNEWMSRYRSQMASTKNQSCVFPTEGWLYANHGDNSFIVEMMYAQRTGWYDFDPVDMETFFQSRVCALAWDFKDTNNRGDNLRNDDATKWKMDTRGDSHSYDGFGERDSTGFSMLEYYGLLSNDADSENLAKTYRILSYENDTVYAGSQRPIYWWSYYYLNNATELNDTGIKNALGTFTYDNAYDEYVWRKGFITGNDTRIKFSGGDELDQGHPEASFTLQVYANGVDWIDETQVNNGDTERTEWHKNTIVLTNTSTGHFYYGCGDDAYRNQYIGANTCDKPAMSSYPNYTKMPAATRGDIEDYAGAWISGGFHAYEPYTYTDSDPVREVIIFGDGLYHADYVDRNESGYIGHHWVNLYPEISGVVSDTSITMSYQSSDGEYLLQLLSSDLSYDIYVDRTNQASREKTGEKHLWVNYSYYHYGATGSADTAVFSHQWSRGANQDNATAITTPGGDRGAVANRSSEWDIVLFDTNRDGNIAYSDYSVDGWGLAFREGASYDYIEAHNITELNDSSGTYFTSSQDVSIIINRTNGVTSFYLNTMKPCGDLDCDQNVTITINETSFSLTTGTYSLGELPSPPACDFSGYLGKGLNLYCTPAGCRFKGMNCHFNATRTGTATYKT